MPGYPTGDNTFIPAPHPDPALIRGFGHPGFPINRYVQIAPVGAPCCPSANPPEAFAVAALDRSADLARIHEAVRKTFGRPVGDPASHVETNLRAHLVAAFGLGP